jgi:REP element-mobilizing transposase RayT
MRGQSSIPSRHAVCSARVPVAFHLVAKSLERRLLWRTWAEARVLWDAVVRATPGRIAIVLMPDHLHLVHPLDVRTPLAAALSGFTRWRHRACGGEGRLCAPVWSEDVADETKLRILVKYVHLNPCRSGLASDPLAWPFSTHRDACGLALPAVVPQARYVAGFHRFVSSDPFVVIGGTPLPDGAVAVHEPFAVLEAVSALTRTSLSQLRLRGSVARSLYLRAAFVLAPTAPRRAIGDLVGASRDGAARAAARSKGDVQLVAKVLSDERFPALHTRPLEWPGRPYRR